MPTGIIYLRFHRNFDKFISPPSQKNKLRSNVKNLLTAFLTFNTHMSHVYESLFWQEMGQYSWEYYPRAGLQKLANFALILTFETSLIFAPFVATHVQIFCRRDNYAYRESRILGSQTSERASFLYRYTCCSRYQLASRHRRHLKSWFSNPRVAIWCVWGSPHMLGTNKRTKCRFVRFLWLLGAESPLIRPKPRGWPPSRFFLRETEKTGKKALFPPKNALFTGFFLLKTP